MSVPETGDDSAMGVHEESGLRWERCSRRHRYVTERAFILLNAERFTTIDKKINILGAKVKDKSVIITEDSIVRGDTTKVIIEKMRQAGAQKKSMSSSPSHASSAHASTASTCPATVNSSAHATRLSRNSKNNRRRRRMLPINRQSLVICHRQTRK